ncbi:MAG: ABC transporter substrate-binding protein [Chloroflexota bacterium]
MFTRHTGRSLSRREFIRGAMLVVGLSATTSIVGACTPSAAPPAAQAPSQSAGGGAQPASGAAKAPTSFKGSTLSILQGTYFIAPGQDLYKKQAQEWGTQNGVTVNTDFLNWPDLQPKIAAAVQAGGLDIVELWPVWNYLYRDNLVDLTDMAEEVGQRGGGYEAYVATSAKVGDRYLGVPHGTSNASMAYRISMFKDAGVADAEDGTKIDMTWDQYFEVAKKLKQKGTPFGQALGHSTGDPPGFVYPYMWSNGAMEVEADGKTIAFNKPEFVDAMNRFVQAWKDGYDETGTSWDDSNNNRAYLAGQIASTYNGSSIYSTAKKDNPAIAQDTHHMLIPRGPAGRFYLLETRTFAILKNSKNIDAAKAYLQWWFDDKQYGDWFHIQEGYFLQNTKKWASDPMWEKDPKMAPFREQPKYGRNQGYAGPGNEKASLAWSKFIIVDTVAKAVQSGDATKSIAWGADELQRIYRD